MLQNLTAVVSLCILNPRLGYVSWFAKSCHLANYLCQLDRFWQIITQLCYCICHMYLQCYFISTWISMCLLMHTMCKGGHEPSQGADVQWCPTFTLKSTYPKWLVRNYVTIVWLGQLEKACMSISDGWNPATLTKRIYPGKIPTVMIHTQIQVWSRHLLLLLLRVLETVAR